MRTVIVRRSGGCPDGNTCPTLHRSDRGTWVLQGYVCEDVPPKWWGRDVVELPKELVPELAEHAPEHVVHLTGRGTVLVAGRSVTDPEALACLGLPSGEAAVEVEPASLPALVEGDSSTC